MDERRTDVQEWVQRRAAAVMDVYTTYDALLEGGVDVGEPGEDMQIPCPFHPDTRPSARYYARSGRDARFHCFKCKYHLHSIDVFAKFKNLEFMEALKQLERRFRINVPKIPELQETPDPVDRGSDYVSEAWSDVPRVLKILEDRLTRLRYVVPMGEYIKFCRVLDSVKWDFDRLGSPGPGMVEILGTVKKMMEDAAVAAAETEL